MKFLTHWLRSHRCARGRHDRTTVEHLTGGSGRVWLVEACVDCPRIVRAFGPIVPSFDCHAPVSRRAP